MQNTDWKRHLKWNGSENWLLHPKFAFDAKHAYSVTAKLEYRKSSDHSNPLEVV